MFSALTNNHGDLNNKLNSFLALAPVAYMGNITDSFISDMANQWKSLMPVAKLFGIYGLNDPDTDKNLQRACFFIPSICDSLKKM